MGPLLNKENVGGIILAGGKGTRFGRNKGMAVLNGRYLIEYVIENLEQCCDEILISSNFEECKRFGYPVIPDEFPSRGPMAGIHACLKASKHEHNVVISVDTPFAGPDFIRYLLRKRSDALISAPWYKEDHYEPLCAYYHKDAVPVMEEFFRNGNNKLPDVFQALPFTPIPIHDKEEFYHPMLFHNINTREDLEKAEQYLKGKR